MIKCRSRVPFEKGFIFGNMGLLQRLLWQRMTFSIGENQRSVRSSTFLVEPSSAA